MHEQILDLLLKRQDQLTGMHANTQIPKVIGFKRVTDVAADQEWGQASAFFWETVVKDRTVAIGGNSVRKHFHPADDFTPMRPSTTVYISSRKQVSGAEESLP